MNKNMKLVTLVIFYGSIWGILEATLGHLLHFIPVTIAGSIMFPIASYILYKAYKKTDSKRALIYIGIVAASIKAIDFLLPALSIYKTINPMISILLEALVVAFVIKMITKEENKTSYLALPIASISWRTVFITYMGIQFIITGNMAPYIRTLQAGLTFVVFSGLLSGLLASLLIFIDRHYLGKIKNFEIKPVYAMALLIIAAITTYTL